METFYLLSFCITTVTLLNSLVNPLVYSVRMRQFRVSFIELLTCRTAANVAEAEEIEMRMFGSPNAVVRLQQGQLHGLDQQRTEQATRNTAIDNSVDVPVQHENDVFL